MLFWHDEFCIQNDEFCIQMADFRFKMMNSAFKMRDLGQADGGDLRRLLVYDSESGRCVV